MGRNKKSKKKKTKVQSTVRAETVVQSEHLAHDFFLPTDVLVSESLTRRFISSMQVTPGTSTSSMQVMPGTSTSSMQVMPGTSTSSMQVIPETSTSSMKVTPETSTSSGKGDSNNAKNLKLSSSNPPSNVESVSPKKSKVDSQSSNKSKGEMDMPKYEVVFPEPFKGKLFNRLSNWRPDTPKISEFQSHSPKNSRTSTSNMQVTPGTSTSSMQVRGGTSFRRKEIKDNPELFQERGLYVSKSHRIEFNLDYISEVKVYCTQNKSDQETEEDSEEREPSNIIGRVRPLPLRNRSPRFPPPGIIRYRSRKYMKARSDPYKELKDSFSVPASDYIEMKIDD